LRLRIGLVLARNARQKQPVGKESPLWSMTMPSPPRPISQHDPRLDIPGEVRPDLPVSQGLPRQLYWLIIGLAVWLVVSVWGFIGGGYDKLVLVVVSLFIGIAVGLPLVLALIANRHRQPLGGNRDEASLSDWAHTQFDANSGLTRGSTAIIEVLLPLCAVAFGMTLFAIVHFLEIGS
jgi:hypothetical protein